MIITYKLVGVIEDYSDVLVHRLLRKAQTSGRTKSCKQVPVQDLKHRIFGTDPYLTEWLLHKNKANDERYSGNASRRVRRGSPLGELIWATLLMNNKPGELLPDEAYSDGPLELQGQLEQLSMLGQSFDCAIRSAAVGCAGATYAGSQGTKGSLMKG